MLKCNFSHYTAHTYILLFVFPALGFSVTKTFIGHVFQDALFNSLLDDPYLSLQLTGKSTQQVTESTVSS